jgi:predicted MFS family arabinose efflux permease
MNPLERRSVGVLAAIYALRMAGLFLIFPVFSLYAEGLSGQTPALIGVALGVYGLSQALLQIPYGVASDYLGRKPVIVVGLLVFAAGSVLAATSTSIYGVIAGRALQGAGAIAAAVMALVADLTREEQRTKAMAIIGVTIGGSMLLSLVIGPLLNGVIGVPGMFWMTAILALAATLVLWFGVPRPVRPPQPTRDLAGQFARILRDGRLLRLDAGIFFLHLVITAMFLVLPHALLEHAGLPVNQHWQVYLPVMVAGVLTMIPFVIYANRGNRMRQVIIGAVAVLIVSEILLYFFHTAAVPLLLALWIFFSGFNLLEATLPSLISRLAPPESKGAAIGVYSTSQFLGAFVGGVLGGWVYGQAGIGAVFLLAAGGLTLWLLAAATMPTLHLLATRTLAIGRQSPAQAEKLARKLSALPGVAEAIVLAEEGMAYLKVEPRRFDEAALNQLLPKATVSR